jgi:hypothetical protein
MVAKTRVAVYGRSAVLAGVGVALSRHPGIEMLPAWIGPGDALPDVILFDTGAPEAETVVALLREQPGVRLIGLDVRQATAITLTERQDSVATMSDLAQVIVGEVEG